MWLGEDLSPFPYWLPGVCHLFLNEHKTAAPLVCATFLIIVRFRRAPLLPKLRGHFAEFLNEGSLERLRILTLPTCVSFSTVTHASTEPRIFLEVLPMSSFKKNSIRDLDVIVADLPTTCLGPETPTFTRAIIIRPPSPLSVHVTGAGILTCCPSTTPFGLALGAA